MLYKFQRTEQMFRTLVKWRIHQHEVIAFLCLESEKIVIYYTETRTLKLIAQKCINFYTVNVRFLYGMPL